MKPRFTAETEATIRSFISELTADESIPGLAIAVVDSEETVYQTGIGERDRDRGAPVSPQTLFGIGSTTKSFTATTVMSLVEDGIVTLDDPIQNYLPVAFSEEVTIHHLLSHTSGAPSNGMANILLSRLTGVGELGVPLADREDFIDHVNRALAEGTYPPGSRFFYYASGFTLLGMLIEEVTGEPYRDVVKNRVLGPLGMDRSTFDQDAFEATTNRMTPYAPTRDGFQSAPFPFHDLIDATGGLLAPVDELAKYVRTHLREGELDGTRILSPASVAKMMTPHADLDGEMGVDEYGYATMIDSLVGERLVGHSGDAVVSTGYVGFLPDAGFGVALGCNTSPSFKLNVLGKAILGIVLGADVSESAPYFARRNRFESLTGTYEAFRGTKQATFKLQGAQPILEVEGMIGSTTVPLDVVSVGDTQVHFRALQPSMTPMEVLIEESDDRTHLLMDRWQLQKVS